MKAVTKRRRWSSVRPPETTSVVYHWRVFKSIFNFSSLLTGFFFNDDYLGYEAALSYC